MYKMCTSWHSKCIHPIGRPGKVHTNCTHLCNTHDDVMKWKYFPRYWPYVRGIHRSRWFPRTKASDAGLWCFIWSAPEKRLIKQWWGWRFETPSRPLWRHCNVIYILTFFKLPLSFMCTNNRHSGIQYFNYRLNVIVFISISTDYITKRNGFI